MNDSATSPFSYPGSKTQLAPWIIDQMPDHHCYVEVFGGSAAVLVNKPESSVEVFNDKDGDIVHFFEVLRDSAEELVEWLDKVPFSRELHQQWASEFYNGLRPSDDIERAGRFFYLRETQFAQKYTRISGFRASRELDLASIYDRKADQLRHFADRFSSVQIEKLDYKDLIQRYDAPDTLFYCDPPYMDEGDELYSHNGFDHLEFSGVLQATDADWIVSYTRVPDPLDSERYTILERDKRVTMRAGQDGGGWQKDVVERLVMSFDPLQNSAFEGVGQTQERLSQFNMATDGGGNDE